jgi:hypothetical protein
MFSALVFRENSDPLVVPLPEGINVVFGRRDSLPSSQRLPDHKYISRDHFDLIAKDGQVKVTQLGKNSVYLDGVPVPRGPEGLIVPCIVALGIPSKLPERGVISFPSELHLPKLAVLCKATHTTPTQVVRPSDDSSEEDEPTAIPHESKPVHRPAAKSSTPSDEDDLIPPPSRKPGVKPAPGGVWEWKSRVNGKDGDPRSWARYSDEVSRKLEAAFRQEGGKVPTVSIDETYSVTFDDADFGMVQYRKDDPSRWRAVRRVGSAVERPLARKVRIVRGASSDSSSSESSNDDESSSDLASSSSESSISSSSSDDSDRPKRKRRRR